MKKGIITKRNYEHILFLLGKYALKVGGQDPIKANSSLF